MTVYTFDELIKKREQAKQDKLAVTEIKVPGTDHGLLFKKPTDARMLDIFGAAAEAQTAAERLKVASYAIYHCCEQMQDTKLQDALGVAEPPEVVDMLFSIYERNLIGGELLRWLGVISAENETEETAKK